MTGATHRDAKAVKSLKLNCKSFGKAAVLIGLASVQLCEQGMRKRAGFTNFPDEFSVR
jgi:hypothetical protein